MMSVILVVDDDAEIRDVIHVYLRLVIAAVAAVFVANFINRQDYAYSLRHVTPAVFVIAFIVSFYKLTRGLVDYLLKLHLLRRINAT